MAKFALLGYGYIAQRHVQAIHHLNHDLVLVYDPNLSSKDEHPFQVANREEDFFQHVQENQLDIVSICTPSNRHHQQIINSLQAGADVIVEKPTVLLSAELDSIQAKEQQTGHSVSTIFQLRFHPALQDLFIQETDQHHQIEITYSGTRDQAYFDSWKGDQKRSGGIVSAVGIHYFDLLIDLFGSVKQINNNQTSAKQSFGNLDLEQASVHWDFQFHDTATSSLPVIRTFRIDDQEIDLSTYDNKLHQLAYEEVLNGQGLSTNVVRPTIELMEQLNFG